MVTVVLSSLLARTSVLRTTSATRRVVRLALVAGLLHALAACGATGGDDPPQGATSTEATTSSVPPEALTRDVLHSAVGESFGDSEVTSEQITCLTDLYVAEVGLDALTELGIPRRELFSSRVLDEVVGRGLEFTADFVSPLFDCIDMRESVLEDLSDVDPPNRDCVADAVLADREVRLIFLLGTTGGVEDPELDAVLAPALRGYREIVRRCVE